MTFGVKGDAHHRLGVNYGVAPPMTFGVKGDAHHRLGVNYVVAPPMTFWGQRSTVVRTTD